MVFSLSSLRKKISRTSRGFTLVEIMIVIAVLGLLFLAMSHFNVSASVNQQRAEYMTNVIHDMIRDARQDTFLGKMPSAGTIATERTVYIGKDSFKRTIKTADGTITTEGQSFEPPFFDGDNNYKVDTIRVSTGVLSHNYEAPLYEGDVWLDADEIGLIFKPGSTLSSGLAKKNGNSVVGNNEVLRSYAITVDYKGFKRYIYGDMLNGDIFMKNQDSNKNADKLASVGTVVTPPPTSNPATPPTNPNPPTPPTPTPPPSCPLPNQVRDNAGVCVNTTQVCSSTDAGYIANGNSEKTWNAAANAYGPCTLKNCNPGFHKEGNSCVPNKKTCTLANGSGEQTWNTTTNTW